MARRNDRTRVVLRPPAPGDREAFVAAMPASVQPGNTDSIALLRRCGFDPEGFSPRYLKVGGAGAATSARAIRAEAWRARR